MDNTYTEPDMEEEEIPYEELSETLRMVVDAQQEYLEDADLKEELASEITVQTEPIVTEDDTREFEVYTLNHYGNSMKFLMETIGDPDRKGNYPLYITLHGEGSGTQEENNHEWRAMFSYYKSAVHNGIYIAVRAVTDTWDLHFRPESYPLYDRLIQAMIMNYHVDPDRVYLLGFSAGGDGVYQIAPRMADRHKHHRMKMTNRTYAYANSWFSLSYRNISNLLCFSDLTQRRGCVKFYNSRSQIFFKKPIDL
ncbi:MAG: hypothetical protein J6D38_01545 [Solobacterium sp.]|nr:hypothetical protein [Solobacterium sp.]